MNVHARHPETGKPICGARTRRPNRFGEHVCLTPPMHNSSGRCRMHGGTSLRGVDHPNFKHGRCIPRDRDLFALAEAILDQLGDEDFLSMREEIALVRVRLVELVEDLERLGTTTEAALAAQQAQSALRHLQVALAQGNATHLQRGIALLVQAVQAGTAVREDWTEISRHMAVLTRLIRSEQRLEETSQYMIPNVDLVLILNHVREVILGLGLTPDQRRQLKRGLAEVLEYRPVKKA